VNLRTEIKMEATGLKLVQPHYSISKVWMITPAHEGVGDDVEANAPHVVGMDSVRLREVSGKKRKVCGGRLCMYD
jgi:hypothetical protein